MCHYGNAACRDTSDTTHECAPRPIVARPMTLVAECVPAAPAADAGTLFERANTKALVDGWIREAMDAGEGDEGVVPDYLTDLLKLAEQHLTTKAERAAAVVRRLDGEASLLKQEIARLSARKTTREKGVERVKAYLKLCLEIADVKKVETPFATVAIQTNPPALKGELPDEELSALYVEGSPFVRYTPATVTLDRKAVLDAYKADPTTLPDGLTVERGASVRIR